MPRYVLSKLYSQTNGEHEYCLCVCPALLANIPIHIHTCFLSITQCKGGKVCVIEILVFIMAIMLKSPHSSYMFFFIISHISSKKRGKVCMRYLCPLWLSCSSLLIIHIIFYSITQTEPRAHPRKGSTKRVKMKRLLRQINQSLWRWKEGTMWESIHIPHQGSNPLEWSVFSLSLSRCGQRRTVDSCAEHLKC